MFHQTVIPTWILAIFSLLCLFQVQAWFEEIIEEWTQLKQRFTWMGALYTILPNRSFIIDESLNRYGIQPNLRCLLN